MEAPIVIVGASLSGLRTAEAIRALGVSTPIKLYGAEPRAPYDRPPLSKEVMADRTRSDTEWAQRLTFRQRPSLIDVEFCLGVEVTSVELAAQTLHTAQEAQPFSGLVAATGLRSRRLTLPGPQRGRFAVRTLDDAFALKQASQVSGNAVVVGGGFIGCEIACTLHGLGHQVTVIEPTGPPMNQALGREVATGLQAHLERAGVRFVTGQGVVAYAGEDAVREVVLSNGESLPADLAVEAVGSQCNVEWLAGNALDLSDGVLVDNQLRAAPGLVAVGDVARFPNPRYDQVARRVEHWAMAADTAARAAATLAADLGLAQPVDDEFRPLPSFWSDQLDLNLWSFGSLAIADDVQVSEGDLARPTEGVLVSYLRAGALVGVLSINLPPKRLRELRNALS